MSGHATFAPSSAHRWLCCPGGQARIILDGVESTSTIYADEGTAAHALLEKCLRQEIPPHQFHGSIDVNEDGNVQFRAREADGRFPIDSEMIDAVSEAYDYAHQRMTEHPDAEMLIEQKSRMFDHRHDVGGTADIVIDELFGTLEVIDYKHGRGILVDVEKNDQLRMYLYGMARRTNFSHETYRYTIVQPRHSHYSGPIWEEIDRSDLLEWGRNVREVIEWIDVLVKQDAPLDQMDLNPGSWCRFCPLKTKCPELAKQAADAAKIDFADDPQALDIGAYDTAAVLKWVPVLEDWLKAVRQDVEIRMIQGEKVDGFKVVRRRANRQWDPEKSEAEIEQAMKEYGIRYESLYAPPKMLTPAAVERKVPKEQRATFNETLVVKPDAGLTIAPEKDRRQAVDVWADQFPED